jgi:hypothetical protein
VGVELAVDTSVITAVVPRTAPVSRTVEAEVVVVRVTPARRSVSATVAARPVTSPRTAASTCVTKKIIATLAEEEAEAEVPPRDLASRVMTTSTAIETMTAVAAADTVIIVDVSATRSTTSVHTMMVMIVIM